MCLGGLIIGRKQLWGLGLGSEEGVGEARVGEALGTHFRGRIIRILRYILCVMSS